MFGLALVYRWLPLTVNWPPLPVIVPEEVFPSPQWIVAEYSLAVADVFGSLIVATWPLNP